ncbi:transporter, partial [Streptomyces sp. NRRL F-6602]
MSRASRMTRTQFEEGLFGVLRWVVIAFLVLITVVPFYYMLLLSVKPIDALLLDPGQLWISAKEFTLATYESVLKPTSEGGQGFLS